MNTTTNEKIEQKSYRLLIEKSTKFTLKFNNSNESNLELNALKETLQKIFDSKSKRNSLISIDVELNIQMKNTIKSKQFYDNSKTKLKNQTRENKTTKINHIAIDSNFSHNVVSFFMISIQIDIYEKIINKLTSRFLINLIKIQ